MTPISSDVILDIFETLSEKSSNVETGTRVSESRVGYSEIPAPFYDNAEQSLRLYQADSIELLRRARDESVDMVFADPPYFLSNGGVTCINGRMVSVNKGKWDKSQGLIGDHAFNILWLEQCRRILKPHGTLWVSGTSHNIYSVGHALQLLGYKILNDIAWYKINPPPNLSCRRFTHATETILWAAKSDQSKYTFHYGLMKEQNGGKQMQSLWHILPPGKAEKRHGKHPTQKPEALLTRIVEASTSPGDLVLDPFCGSGTTGVACARLGRRFIGIDWENEYIELAMRRYANEAQVHQETIIFHMSTTQSFTDKCHILNMDRLTWREIVSAALNMLGGEASLSDINRLVMQNPRTQTNVTWTCTIRRVVRQSADFECAGRGRYRLRQGLTMQ